MNPSTPHSFQALGLLPALVRATADESYLEPTPVQREVIPAAIAGRDVLACAQTGTGKTAAFVLPILQNLAGGSRNTGLAVLILTPTRELAAQIAERVQAYGRHLQVRHAVIYGGVSQMRQEAALRQRPELLVATPGRLLDLMGQGLVKLDQVRHFVLDEADRMLDMGFIHDVRRVLSALPKQRQTLFFSATVPRPIETLAQGMLVDPVRVSVTPKVTAAETVDQSVVFVAKENKADLLEKLLNAPEVERAIVFTRTKHGADKLSRRLERGGVVAPAIHGNKSQNARERALSGFKTGKTRVLIATDIAARGIDVDGVTHVYNYDLPNVPESYVHRIGRTGRAGASGRAIAFCDRDERPLLADIERLLRQRLRVVDMTAIRPETAAVAVASNPAEASAPAPSAPVRQAERDTRPRHDARQDRNAPGARSWQPSRPERGNGGSVGHERRDPQRDRPSWQGRPSNERPANARPANGPPVHGRPANGHPHGGASGAPQGSERGGGRPWWQKRPERDSLTGRGS
ncbi:MAG TPA: DEAD/DEAH box helicase [Polyangiaceae bacterium]|nr:DEAD/DEAH box helicase [Polyangiaceae bacterium]